MNWQKQWIIGNWKMNGRQAQIGQFLQALAAKRPPESCLIGIALPSPFLANAKNTIDALGYLGAEDVSQYADDGAYTGEVSAQMLGDVGAQFALIGHSERRQYFAEANSILAQKIQNAHQAKLTPILCVGETAQERDDKQAFTVIKTQLAVLKDLALPHFAVAYEPIWAIGTGRVAQTEQIREMHQFIYETLLSFAKENANIRVLYGGSVNADNAAHILSIPKVDGALVGGASLKADSFAAIIQATLN